MAVSCQTIIDCIEKLAPRKLAFQWDNVGLQMGSPAQRVERVFLSLDLDERVLTEAEEFGADMLIVHHTPFFKPLTNLRTDKPSGRLLARMAAGGTALFAAHTNLDCAPGGVNDVLARLLGLNDITLLCTDWRQKLYKLVVYVPREHAEQIREALGQSGAGWIGNYSHCSFAVDGVGAFLPLAGSQPYLGRPGQLERVDETRLETIVPEEIVQRVLKAVLKVHPYEEVAYDLYPLANDGHMAGLGRCGVLPQPLSLGGFIDLVKEKLSLRMVRYSGSLQQKIEKVAVCGGSGGELISKAVFAGAQVLLTADIKYHEAQEALGQGLALVDAGHFATEQPVIPALASYLRQELAPARLNIAVSDTDTDPFGFY